MSDVPQTPVPDSWTIQRVLTWSTGFLRDKQSESPRLDAELLLSHALGCSRIQLYTSYDKPLLGGEREPFKQFLKRRVAGEPIAYITGTKEFMGLAFAVTPAVLIPRPDTEVLVETALLRLKATAGKPARVLDVGTGSGCIAISIAKKAPEAEVTAWDVDEAALAVARDNAARHGVEARVQLARVDALDASAWSGAPFDLIVSNPPYIGAHEKAALPVSVAGYEPARALFADEEGLAFYRVFAERGRELLADDGRLMVEIGHAQGAAVKALLEAHGWRDVAVLKDYGRLDRVVVARP